MEHTFSISEAAAMLGKHVKTLQRWDKIGLLIPLRTPTNRRAYTLSQLQDFVGLKPASKEERVTIAYCRVSSQAQKPDLKNQRNAVIEFCQARGIGNVEVIEEVGGGLNFKRKRFLNLVDRIVQNEVSLLVLAHKDRLVRFGFDFFVDLCKKHNCEVVVIDNEKLSPEQEMVQDLMTIVHCFSSRLYGLRNYKKTIKKALQDEVGA